MARDGWFDIFWVYPATVRKRLVRALFGHSYTLCSVLGGDVLVQGGVQSGGEDYGSVRDGREASGLSKKPARMSRSSDV
ncbi:hypothetical protein BGX30_000485 [Mortierella sp. GBA39]|nr:hypothetical protein BGX30_000485 [Mortierella sp. GBA39]